MEQEAQHPLTATSGMTGRRRLLRKPARCRPENGDVLSSESGASARCRRDQPMARNRVKHDRLGGDARLDDGTSWHQASFKIAPKRHRTWGRPITALAFKATIDEPPASPYAIMRRVHPYCGENSGPCKDDRGRA
jgi:hypothetical protein